MKIFDDTHVALVKDSIKTQVRFVKSATKTKLATYEIYELIALEANNQNYTEFNNSLSPKHSKNILSYRKSPFELFSNFQNKKTKYLQKRAIYTDLLESFIDSNSEKLNQLKLPFEVKSRKVFSALMNKNFDNLTPAELNMAVNSIEEVGFSEDQKILCHSRLYLFSSYISHGLKLPSKLQRDGSWPRSFVRVVCPNLFFSAEFSFWPSAWTLVNVTSSLSLSEEQYDILGYAFLMWLANESLKLEEPISITLGVDYYFDTTQDRRIDWFEQACKEYPNIFLKGWW